MNSKIRVLTIDGGGILGIVPAMILQALERKIRHHANDPDAKIVDYFDFVAGTSTGGIIAALLLMPDKQDPKRPRYSTTDIVGFYRDKGPDIFRTSWWLKALGGVGLLRNRYSVDHLESLLLHYLEETKLNQLIKPSLIPAYNLEKASTCFFCSHNHIDGIVPERNFLLRDICRATSAAPSYFKAAAFTSDSQETHVCVDGGVFANNPTLCTIAEVGKTDKNYTPINMNLLSLGTGKLRATSLSPSFLKRITLLNIPTLISIMMDGVAETTDYITHNLFNNLGVEDQYLRLEPEMTDGRVRQMDNASPKNIQKLQEITEEFLQKNDQKLEKWAQRLIPTPEVEGLESMQAPVLDYSKK